MTSSRSTSTSSTNSRASRYYFIKFNRFLTCSVRQRNVKTFEMLMKLVSGLTGILEFLQEIHGLEDVIVGGFEDFWDNGPKEY